MISIWGWSKPPKPLLDRVIGRLRREVGAHNLPDLWCELIDQVQTGESIYWSLYVMEIQRLIREFLLELSVLHGERLWLKSEAGWNFQWEQRWYERNRSADPDLVPPERPEDVTEDLVQWFWSAVCARAADADLERAVLKSRSR